MNQRMRDLASIGHPTLEKLIGVYLRPSDLDDFASTGRFGGAIVCRAYLEGEYASAQETKAAFQKTVAALRRESGPLNIPIRIRPASSRDIGAPHRNIFTEHR